MIGVAPHNCSICYQPYNNERTPLILITCGHTFCKECLEIIFMHETKEIPCPECKQSTYITEPKALPRNRSLLDVIIFHEKIRMSKINKEEINQARGIDTNESGELNKKVKNLLADYADIINKLEETYNKTLEDHSYLTEISELLITKEVDEALDNLIDVINEYRSTIHNKIKHEFEKVNLIKDLKKSINMYKAKLNLFNIKFCQTDNTKNDKESPGGLLGSHQDEILALTSTNNQEIVNSIDKINLNNFEIENLENEIKFVELYSITLKHYSKEIYNPGKFFFMNKYQNEKLTDDLKKLLQRVCDFDENVLKFNLEGLNTIDEKKLIKEIQEACNQSNHKKLKFIFSHLRINPNFIYSELLDHLTYQAVSDREINSNSGNTGMSNALYTLNSIPNNQTNMFGQRTLNPTTINTTSRLITNQYATSPSLISNFKGKINNMYSFLKNIKDKNELNEILKYFIEEHNYLPLKIDAESTTVDIKFGRDFDWKIPLNLV